MIAATNSGWWRKNNLTCFIHSILTSISMSTNLQKRKAKLVNNTTTRCIRYNLSQRSFTNSVKNASYVRRRIFEPPTFYFKPMKWFMHGNVHCATRPNSRKVVYKHTCLDVESTQLFATIRHDAHKQYTAPDVSYRCCCNRRIVTFIRIHITLPRVTRAIFSCGSNFNTLPPQAKWSHE